MKCPFLFCALLAVSIACAQPPASFDVVSIKQTEFPAGQGDAFFAGFSAGAGPCGRARLEISGNRVRIKGATICGLIGTAYGVPDYRIAGVVNRTNRQSPEAQVSLGVVSVSAPLHSQSDFYDIDAVAAGELTQDRAKELLRNMLADRFQVKVHRETKEMPLYALVVDKTGAKLKPAVDGPCLRPSVRILIFDCKMSMPKLVDRLLTETNRPVIDHTELTGDYKVALDWSPESRQNEPNAAPALFTALQEQLGLKLEPRKEQMEIVVVDQAAKASLN